MKHYNIPIFIPHLGCPNKCIFCNQNCITSQSALPEPAEISAIIDRNLATLPVGADIEIAFFGGNFTAINIELQEKYLHAASDYIQRGMVSGIRLSTRPDNININILQFLAERGVKTIELGVQSLNDEVLQSAQRGYSAADVYKAVSLIKEHAFQLGIQLMLGLPGDSYLLDIESTHKTIELKPDMVRIYPTLVIKDTALEELYRQGRYIPLTISEAVKISADMLLLFQEHDIEVIRIGLQPGEDLRSEGTVIAGPFHPAFGELVEQDIFRRQAEYLLAEYLKTNPLEQAVIYINSRDRSKMTGYRRFNLDYLKKAFHFKDIIIEESAQQGRNIIGVSSKNEAMARLYLSRKGFIKRAGPVL